MKRPVKVDVVTLSGQLKSRTRTMDIRVAAHPYRSGAWYPGAKVLKVCGKCNRTAESILHADYTYSCARCRVRLLDTDAGTFLVCKKHGTGCSCRAEGVALYEDSPSGLLSVAEAGSLAMR